MTRIKLDPDKLRDARHRVGYSLREFAEIVGIAHNHLWEYETGRKNPQPRTLRRLANTLGVEVADLVKERR